ncbi:hypothetical protein BDW02DRAFT_398804 [Decorospora gaudefroyi]|uniref:Uncharacterized protein n=1 Tax=Decorospora gaudefroyi TaxID=184978 RepID=A0A6A5K5V1_9PLEO|nr:hypothetical protein BDW02DRAFT_398804 [Decorospora gaudefroyi]
MSSPQRKATPFRAFSEDAKAMRQPSIPLGCGRKERRILLWDHACWSCFLVLISASIRCESFGKCGSQFQSSRIGSMAESTIRGRSLHALPKLIDRTSTTRLCVSLRFIPLLASSSICTAFLSAAAPHPGLYRRLISLATHEMDHCRYSPATYPFRIPH